MNTEQRLTLLNKFTRHLNKKIKRFDKQTLNFAQLVQNNQIQMQYVPKIEIINDLAFCHENINTTITQTYLTISNVINKLQQLKNRKQNISHLLDILTSINQTKNLSYSLKVQNIHDLTQTYKILSNYFQTKQKAKFCNNYIKQIDSEIDKIQIKLKKQFDNQLTKTNSTNIKDTAKIIQLIKRYKDNQLKQNNRNGNKETKKQKGHNENEIDLEHLSSLTQISEFYVNLVKKELAKFQEQLFNIPIVGNPNQISYIFFQIIKNSFKIVVSLIQTYKNNILQLQSSQGLHIVIKNIFKYVMDNLVLEILMRQKKYYEIDKITITRNKVTLKNLQYKILKNYFKEFNVIWNQIQRFRMYLFDYLDESYSKKNEFNKELIDIINSAKLVDFNYEIILYFQGFLRHQLDKILKKNSFVLSLWQFDQDFFKDVKNKNEYKSNLAGQDFIEEMITKFVDGVKKSFQTLNVLIVSAIINFINSNLIGEDSFYAFNELLTRFLGRINSDSKSIDGIILVMNTLMTYPKAIKSSFSQIEIPQELPVQRIQNETSQLIMNCKQKTGDFITQAFNKIINQEFIQSRMRQGKYQEISQIFRNLQNDLYELFIYKLSKSHVQLILTQQFKSSYTHMDVLNLEKEIRNIINFYEQKSYSIRQNFRKILIYIEVLLVENESEFKKFAQQIKQKYQEVELRKIWKLRSSI